MSQRAQDALAWPSICVITPGDCSLAQLVDRTQLLYSQGMRMLVLREPALGVTDQQTLVQEFAKACPELRLVHHLKCPGTQELLGQQAICVHLPASARPSRVQGRSAFGVSVHSEQELIAATRAGASYAMLAPIWSPNSKPGDLRPTLGPEAYEQLLGQSSIPLFALGGVNAQRCRRWRQHPDVRVALIGELYQGSAKRALAAFAALCELLVPA